jgi:hypothetical protein
LKLLGDFALWLILRVKELNDRQVILHDLFSGPKNKLPVPSFPNPSLALTSALGPIFLPSIVQNTETDSFPSVTASGQLCIFYLQVLLTGMPFIGAEIQALSEIIHFLLLHSAFSKDKLALSGANDLWTNESKVAEADFLEYQEECIHLVDKVQPWRLAGADL